MNNQERMMVLKMIEDGKISADEAVKLLDALNAGGIDNFIGESAEKLKVIFTDVKLRAEEFAKKMEPSVNEAKEKIGETYKKMEPGLKDAGEKIKKAANDAAEQITKVFTRCNCEEDCKCNEKQKNHEKED